MKCFIVLPIWLLFALFECRAQKKALNIPGIHQLVSYSKSENSRQNEARDKQSVILANEGVNKTQLARIKNVYRTIQQRYTMIGTAIDAANIGLQAAPMLNRIIRNQQELVSLVSDKPVLLALTYQTEVEFAERAYSLLNYLIGLCASIGDVNQMKAADRRILFDFVIAELGAIQQLSNILLQNIQYGNINALIRSVNPFQGYIDQDVALVNDILRNAKYLKK